MADYFSKEKQMTTTGSNVAENALAGGDIISGVLSANMDQGQVETALKELTDKEQKNVVAITEGIIQKLNAEPKQFELLVRGAELRCTMGSHPRKLNLPECHGVYITGHPAVQKDDCIAGDTANIPTFGVCQSEGHPESKFFGKKVTLVAPPDPANPDAPPKNVKGCPCTPTIVGKWMNCYTSALLSRNEGAGGAGEDPFARTYTNALTTDSFLVCMYGGIIEPKTSGQQEETVEGYDFFKMMEESYGFTPEEAALIKTGYDKFMGNPANQALSEKERAQKFFANMSALTDNYSGEATRWNLVAGNPSTEDAMKYFGELGMSQDDVQALKNAINRQHQDPSAGKDFAHELVQYAIFANDDSVFHTTVGSMIGDLSALGSYKGDVYSTRMGIDDMNSDLDAHNIYNRFSFNTGMNEDLFQTMTNYNRDVQNKNINRADEFLSNLGNGDPVLGLENLKAELDHVDMGAQYIAQGGKSIMQDAFMTSALVDNGAVLVDPDIIKKSTNRGSIGSATQGGPTVEETKQAFLDYLKAESSGK